METSNAQPVAEGEAVMSDLLRALLAIQEVARLAARPAGTIARLAEEMQDD